MLDARGRRPHHRFGDVGSAQQASAVSLGAAAATFPATPFGTFARALVQAIDRGGGPPLRALLDSTAAPAMFLQWTPARYAAMLDRLAAQSGGFEVVRVREVGTAIRVFMRTKKDGRMVGLELSGLDAVPGHAQAEAEHAARVLGVQPLEAASAVAGRSAC